MNKNYYLSIILFSVLLAIKVYFLIHFENIIFVSDSSSYLLNTYRLFDGESLIFDMRPPGYSYFIYFIWIVFQKSYFTLIFAQIVINCFSYSLFYLAVSKLYNSLSLLLPVYIGMISIIPVFMCDDYIVYSESLSYSLFILSTSFFLFSIISDKFIFQFLFGLFIAVTILTKLALLPILVFPFILLIYLYIFKKHKISKSLVLCFGPTVLSIALLSFHNKKTIDTYSVSKFGDFAKLMTVIFWIDEDCTDNLSEKKAIAFMKSKMNETDINIVRKSNNLFDVSHNRYLLYTNNCENIWHYFNYLTDSCHYSQIQIYKSAIPIYNKAKHLAGLRSYNHQVNMLYGFLFSLKTCKFGLYSCLNRTASHEFYKKYLFKSHYEKPEFIELLNLKEKTSESSSIFDKLTLFISIAFRNLLWYLVFCFSILVFFYKLFKEKRLEKNNVFFLGLILFLFSYVFLLVYCAHADTIRYTFFSSFILYFSLFHLLTEVKAIFINLKNNQ